MPLRALLGASMLRANISQICDCDDLYRRFWIETRYTGPSGPLAALIARPHLSLSAIAKSAPRMRTLRKKCGASSVRHCRCSPRFTAHKADSAARLPLSPLRPFNTINAVMLGPQKDRPPPPPQSPPLSLRPRPQWRRPRPSVKLRNNLPLR